MKYDVVIIGGGPAGLGAATALYEKGVRNLLIIERDIQLGGILQQCIHNGFGIQEFKEELTGPEYAQRFIDRVNEYQIEYKTDTMVLEISDEKQIHYLNSKEGYQSIEAKAIVLAMGCRERTSGAISLPGTRPAGVITAGTAQYYLNIKGYLVGKKVFILGSGDIGLIMARRMTLEGAKVLGVAEIMPYSAGLTRNLVQCLEDFDIPLYLRHTVTQIYGKDRIQGITLSEVDQDKKPVEGTEKYFEVDALLLSVGLIPDEVLMETTSIRLHPRTSGPVVNESMETSVDGIFACGNVVHVHDVVDFVTKESRKAADGVAHYLMHQKEPLTSITCVNGSGVSYIVPQMVNVDRLPSDAIELFFRTSQRYEASRILCWCDDQLIKTVNKGHLVPAEMEHLIVNKKDIPKGAKSLKIEIVAKEAISL